MRACIAIDGWKLTIFRSALDQSGYDYEQGAGITPDTISLYVETYDIAALEVVVRAANAEAAKSQQRTLN